MPHHTNIAERIAYGHPVEVPDDAQPIAARPTSALIGRLLMAVIFLVAGFEKLGDLAGTAGYMQAAGIPAANALAVVVGLAEVAGGLSLVFGFLGRLGAIGLFIYMIPTTLVFHHFWNLEGAERQMQMINFMKNLGIMGGLALLFAYGPGRYSLDARVRRPYEP